MIGALFHLSRDVYEHKPLQLAGDDFLSHFSQEQVAARESLKQRHLKNWASYCAFCTGLLQRSHY